MIGGNPGGGGIELLSRLVGRSRALEIVLGADRLDADTAALYGCMLFFFRSHQNSSSLTNETGINRAVPDAQFDRFVDQYARRVAGWDHFAIAAAKKLINGRTGFPTAAQQQESFNSFLADVAQGSVAERLKALGAAGLQTSEKFEIHLPDEELKFLGDGPWKA